MRAPLLKQPRIGAQGGTIGKPRKLAPDYAPVAIRETPPQDIAQQIESLAAIGRSKVFIARHLGTSIEIFNRWLSEDSMLAWMFKAGRAKHEAKLVDRITADAFDGEKPNINAFFLLKNLHGWREGEQTDPGSRVNITFNLPGSMSREEFMKSVVTSDG